MKFCTGFSNEEEDPFSLDKVLFTHKLLLLFCVFFQFFDVAELVMTHNKDLAKDASLIRKFSQIWL
jgi:hypothetical protein